MQDVRKLLNTLQQSYSKSPYSESVYPIIEDILNYEKRDIPNLCLYSYKKIFNYLGINKEIIFSTDLEYDRTQAADQKLVSICKELGGAEYINSPGGRELYNTEIFQPHGIELKFIETNIEEYPQYGAKEFVPYLSIIDILMNLPKEQVIEQMKSYKLVD
ncbi:WbqC family protein [Marinospirillum insulare]|uniref:WbqC family protein n=1 Tax=Marinospirillum insulare TaxID=217169 RepID=UPI000A042CA4|nr:WbqC family protein [Marinospirillum insulare]